MLAGYEPYFDSAQPDDGASTSDLDDASPQGIAAVLEGIRWDVHVLASALARRDKDTDAPSNLTAVAGNALRRAVLPAVYTAAVGYALTLAGVGDVWALMAFVAIPLCLALVQGLLRWRWANPVGEMFFISLVFLHSALLLQAALLNMDPYGLYTVAGFAGTPVPVLLALLVGLALALAAAVMFDLLWNWQYGPRGARSAYARALWVVFPPLLFTYGNLVVFGNSGSWLYNLMSLGILGGCFATITALKDPALRPSKWDRRIMLAAAIQAVIILATVSALGMLFAYL